MKIVSLTCHLLRGRWTGDPSFPSNMRATAFVQVDTDDGVFGVREIALAYFAPETVLSAPRSIHKNFLLESLEPRDGVVGVTSEPGLGVRFDPQLLEKYPFLPGSGERT